MKYLVTRKEMYSIIVSLYMTARLPFQYVLVLLYLLFLRVLDFRSHRFIISARNDK